MIIWICMTLLGLALLVLGIGPTIRDLRSGRMRRWHAVLLSGSTLALLFTGVEHAVNGSSGWELARDVTVIVWLGTIALTLPVGRGAKTGSD